MARPRLLYVSYCNLFIKLLEAVLKTGNRLNTGTFRGDAKACKLDTLLKLLDVKGVDGKTTLLHFVIQEIIKAEGARAARMASVHDPFTPPSTRSSMCTTPSGGTSPSSPLSHFVSFLALDRNPKNLGAVRSQLSTHWRRSRSQKNVPNVGSVGVPNGHNNYIISYLVCIVT